MELLDEDDEWRTARLAATAVEVEAASCWRSGAMDAGRNDGISLMDQVKSLGTTVSDPGTRKTDWVVRMRFQGGSWIPGESE